MAELKEFLEKRRVTEKTQTSVTHIMMEAPKGKYHIKEEDESILYKMLAKTKSFDSRN